MSNALPDVSLAAVLRTLTEREGTLCPNCGQGKMHYTGQHFSLLDRLDEWEKQVGGRIPATVREEYADAPDSHLFSCSKCSFGMFYPPIAGTAEYYNTIAGAEYYQGVKPEFVTAINYLAPKRPRSLLDVGAGTGTFLRAFAERSPQTKLFAHDLNPLATKALREIATCSDRLEQFRERFDVICAFQLLEHMDDPFAFVETCHSLLADRGTLIIGVPNHAGLYRYFNSSWTETPPHHLTRWSPAALRHLLERRRFTVLKSWKMHLTQEHFSSYLPLLYWLALRKVKLERNQKLLALQKSIPVWAERWGIRRLPFCMGLLMACRKQ